MHKQLFITTLLVCIVLFLIIYFSKDRPEYRIVSRETENGTRYCIESRVFGGEYTRDPYTSDSLEKARQDLKERIEFVNKKRSVENSKWTVVE